MSNILVGVGGGIAAYKVCDIVSSLGKSEHTVRVLLSPKALQFISLLTMSTLSRHPAYTDDMLWDSRQPRPLHIDLGEWADVILLAPLTANTLAELCYGFAQSLLSSVVLASTAPILLAPAMNTTMWQQSIVQENFQTVMGRHRYHAIGPEAGMLACDAKGIGKMTAPENILKYLESLLVTGGSRDLSGKTLLVSAGGTREFMDPVRFIGNPSTGKMGVAVAIAAAHRGAQVHLVIASDVVPPEGLPIQITRITTARQMKQVLDSSFPDVDWVIMAAAVADFAPQDYSTTKLPKNALSSGLAIEPVPDLIQNLASQKQAHQRLIGFAAQTGSILEPAKDKLIRKNLDAIIANPIDQPQAGFGSDFNQAVWIDRTGQEIHLPLMGKLEMAHQILNLVLDLECL